MLVSGDFGMGLLGFCYVCFGSRFWLILVYIDLVDSRRDGFGCWACGMELSLGALRGKEDSLVGSSRLEKKIEKKEEREKE